MTYERRRVVFFRHHGEDEPGLLGEAFEAMGFDVAKHDVCAGASWPAPQDIDAAVILGSKWSVYDREAVGSWITEELDWIRKARQAAIPVLGVCFGAQAMAAALGGTVEPAPTPEIGWVDVDSEVHGLAAGPWFQFHGDRFVPPADAEILAVNEVGVQAFRVDRCLAVQFHPEIDAGQLRAWLANGAAEYLDQMEVDAEVLLAETDLHHSIARINAGGLIRDVLLG